MLQLAASVAAKLNGEARGGAKPLPPAARNNAGRRIEGNYEALIGLANELAKAKDIQVGFLALNKNGEYGAYCLQKGFTYAVHDVSGNTLRESQSNF